MNQFLKMVRAVGWSQAKVARRLKITPGAVSQLCSGRTRPRAATLELLRLVIEEEKREALNLGGNAPSGGLEGWQAQLLESLGRLPKAHRDRLLAGFSALIKVFGAAARFGDTPSARA